MSVLRNIVQLSISILAWGTTTYTKDAFFADASNETIKGNTTKTKDIFSAEVSSKAFPLVRRQRGKLQGQIERAVDSGRQWLRRYVDTDLLNELFKLNHTINVRHHSLATIRLQTVASRAGEVH